MSPKDSTTEKRYVVKALSVIVTVLLLVSPLIAISSMIVPANAQVAPPQIPVLTPAAQQMSKDERNWEYIASGRLGGNYNPQKQITKDNIQYLELKWIWPVPSLGRIPGQVLQGFGTNPAEGVKAPPLVVDGVAYVILNSKTVIALDAKTGKQIWVTPVVASNTNNSIQAGGKYPITTEGSHTHGMNYIDGQIWITDYGCAVTVLNAKTGKVDRQYRDLCLEIPINDPRGVGIPTNSGWYGSLFGFPPTVYKGGNSFFYGQGGASEGTWGGRLYAAMYDINTGKLIWRTFLMPPCGDPKTCGPGKDGPLFVKEKQEWGQWLVDNCNKIWIQGIKACEIDRDILRNDWGDMRSNSGISQIWSTGMVDEETGIVYFGTAQAGPDWNKTYAPGPNLFGASIIALNAKTGALVWAHQTSAHDLWDYDCSWNGVLATAKVKGQTKKVVMKGCKNGIVYILDAATGEALWVFEPPSIKRTPNAYPYNPRSKEDMTKPWLGYPSKDSFWLNCPAGGCLESDIAYDPTRNTVYFAIQNPPSWSKVGPAEIRGVSLASAPAGTRPYIPKVNYTVNAYDLDTGKLKWEFTSTVGVGYRGGIMASGGLVWPTSQDGFFRILDADTGKVVFEKQEQGNVQPSIGATADGKLIVLRYIGDGNLPGAIAAYGLPDNVPAPKEVIKEVIKEVPKEVIKEVPKEVIKTVTVETVSPISYAAIGISVVILVIAGVLFTRRKK
ncbi:MAG: PQQ-binding-like beta-propeller repeat protein [Thaumarchaeota archaeon]|nr:PQQ-binding-like beta-propeller repeat protein [Nitrososphaerota archaeon]